MKIVQEVFIKDGMNENPAKVFIEKG
jgi:hypothetical protein